MKIAIVLPSINGYSGVGKIVGQHVDFLTSQVGGHEVDVITHTIKHSPFNKNFFIKNPFSKNRKVTIKRQPKWWLKKFDYHKFCDFAEKELKQGYSLIISHGIGCKSSDISFFHNIGWRAQQERGDTDVAIPKYNPNDSLMGSLMVVPSEMVKNEYVSLCGFPEDKLDFLVPGVDVKICNENVKSLRGKVLDKYKITPVYGKKPFVVSLIASGELEKTRGLDNFLAVIANLKTRIRELFVIVVGSSNFANRRRIRSKIKKATGNIRFLYIPKIKYLEEIYSVTDLVIHPAIYETFGMVVSEAIACGIPVITNKNVGASALIKDLTTAPNLVVQNTNDVSAMTSASLEVYNNYQHYSEVFSKLGDEVRKNLSWEEHNKKLVKIIDRVIGERSV